MARPIVTFTTDFGLQDAYVAQMKAAVLVRCREAQLVDVTHDIAPGDVSAGGFSLERAVSAFPAGCVHVAVVDPGVGSDRLLLRVDVAGQTLLCPDNGLVTWTLRRNPAYRVRPLVWRPESLSRTFHGRDVLAPAAGMIAAGNDPPTLCGTDCEPILLAMHLADPGESAGRVIQIDRFGNATTNVPDEPPGSVHGVSLSRRRVSVNGRDVGPVLGTYADVASGMPLALIGSSGLLEIAVCGGSAADVLGIKVGDEVKLT